MTGADSKGGPLWRRLGSAIPLPKAVESRIPLSRLPVGPRDELESTHRGAKPGRIARALDAAMARDPGGWFVVGASRDVGRSRSVARTIDGREVVIWRGTSGELLAGPSMCPHLGASLGGCEIVDGHVLCRWHGYALGTEERGNWAPYPALDDGVLLWVQLPVPGETPTDRPALPRRPPLERAVAEVVCVPATCEPRDIIANRLDPWHGSWLHPYAFSHLTVDEEESDESRLVLDVAFRLGKTVAVPVRAEFMCPDARTIVMTILAGEGTGSVVETHATPLGHDHSGRPVTMMVEATVAYSDRPGFAVARSASPLVRWGIRRSARALWQDDATYAERVAQLRRRGVTFY